MLSALDYGVLAVYLLAVAVLGLAVGRGQRTTADYFLARRAIPWWAAGLSILATETSALTFIGVPVQSLRGDWTYLQLAAGSIVGRLAVAALLIGPYYRAGVVTVYGYLGRRFGGRTRNLATLLFFAGRLLGSGVRLYGAAIALVIVADLGFPLAIAAIAAVAVFYTLLGGLRSVVWTDLLQGVLLLAGATAAVIFLLRAGGDGSDVVSRLAAATTATGHSKLRVLNLSLDPREAYTLLAGLIGSAFLTLSTHGTDQDLIQRSLACRDSREARRSLWLSAVLVIPVAALFLAIGSLLWLRLGGDVGAAELARQMAAVKGLPNAEKAYDLLFPLYVVSSLPAGIRGVIVAGILATAMSSLDSAISALSTTAVRCVWRPLFGGGGDDDRGELRMARVLSLLFALLLVGVALLAWRSEGAGGERQGFGVLMLGLKVLTWVFPPLLGVFLVGVLSQRGSDRGNVFAVLLGVASLLAVEFWSDLFGAPAPFAWTWNPVVGCLLTFSVAAVFRPRAGANATGAAPTPLPPPSSPRR